MGGLPGDGALLSWAGEAFSTRDPDRIRPDLAEGHAQRVQPGVAKLLRDLESAATDEVSTPDGSERIVYTALRDADRTCRGILETVLPSDEVVSADDTGEA